MSYADLERSRSLMADAGVDGLLIVAPETFAYVAGIPSGPAAMWRSVGPVAAVVGAEGDLTFIVPDTMEGAIRAANPDANVLSHTLWIERIDVDPASGGDATEVISRATRDRQIDRPETFDDKRANELVRSALGDAGLIGKRVGVELAIAPYQGVEALKEYLGDTELVNSSPLVAEMRIIKTPQEIELLRVGTELAELGMTASLEGLSTDTLQLDIYARYSEAIWAAVREQRIFGLASTRTTVHMGPSLWGTADPRRTLERGDIIQFDSGVNLMGYNSDIGRTSSFGPPTDIARRIEDALLAGWYAGLEALKPGNTYADVFFAAQEAVRKNGFPSYTRGHFGHSIGSELWGEEWPWISATEQRVLEPGMVVAFEVPYYVNGVGGFQNEDNILITETGYESFDKLPMELVSVGD